MATIFYLSYMGAPESNELSKNVTDKMLSVSPQYNQMDTAYKEEKVNNNNDKVRSIAHFSLFLILGLLLLNAISQKVSIKTLIIAFLICACYAVFDEYFQKWLGKGRAFEFIDLLKDWSGSVTGIFISFISAKIRESKI